MYRLLRGFAAALAAMQAFDLPRVAVIALAKREEEVFVPGRAKPVVLSRHDPGLQLLQRIRDEAHRFAVGFHRQRRESRRQRLETPGHRLEVRIHCASPLCNSPR